MSSIKLGTVGLVITVALTQSWSNLRAQERQDAEHGATREPVPLASIPREAISPQNAFVIAYGGEAYFYNHDAGINKAPFLHNVYKSFGFSHDARYFLYLKSTGPLPGFSLYSRDLITNDESKVAEESVHNAAWSPASLQIAYVSMDSANQFHLWVYDVTSKEKSEIAGGLVDPEFLEWSPNGDALLYRSVVPQSLNYIEDHKFTFQLHEYSVRRHKETSVIQDALWARFDGARPLVLSRKKLKGQRQLSNREEQDIRNFTIVEGEIYATVLEKGKSVVKRLDDASKSFQLVEDGDLYGSTKQGVLVRHFTARGVTYKFVSTQTAQTAPAAAFSGNWEMPYEGSVHLVQGGSFTSGTCDGTANCFISSHQFILGYALDLQQVIEEGQGNTHILAVEAGTVAGSSNATTCNAVTTTCHVGWDDYSSSCFDASGGFGNYISVAHPDGSYSFYGHLKSGSLQVAANQTVTQGTYIADQGHSGGAGTYNGYHSCGDHLHFQRQTGPAPWAQSIPTDFTEVACTMACTSSYLSANVETPLPRSACSRLRSARARSSEPSHPMATA